MSAPHARWVLTLLAAVIVGAGLLRANGVMNDRTWYDEDLVLLESHGIPYSQPWPERFLRSELGVSRTLGAVLYNVAHFEDYPPVVHLTIFALRDAPNPILAVRTLYFILGLTLIVVIYRFARSITSPQLALIAAVYVAASPILTNTSQQIKWSAIAGLVSTLASMLLFSLRRADGLGRWIAYAVSLLVLLHTHYFCVWIVPVHWLFVLVYRREILRPFILCGLAVAALLVPWFGFGLPLQFDYVAWQFGTFIPSLAYNTWYQPFTMSSVLQSYAFIFFAVVGLQPSAIRVRYLLPLIPLILWLFGLALRASDRRHREVATVALGVFGLAVLAQTIHAGRLGYIIPLTAEYFVPWIPLVMTTVILGTSCLRSYFVKAVVAGMFLVGAIGNTLTNHDPQVLFAGHSLNNYRSVARLLASFPEREAAIVYRSDRDAKVMNLFYTGSLLQLIKGETANPVSSGVARLIFLSSVREPATPRLPGWTPPQVLAVFGETRVEASTRIEPD